MELEVSMAKVQARHFKLTPRLAKEVYTRAWLEYCLAVSPTRRRQLEIVMDAMQPHIARRVSDKSWQEFIHNLPGFVEFWNRVADVANP